MGLGFRKIYSGICCALICILFWIYVAATGVHTLLAATGTEPMDPGEIDIMDVMYEFNSGIYRNMTEFAGINGIQEAALKAILQSERVKAYLNGVLADTAKEFLKGETAAQLETEKLKELLEEGMELLQEAEDHLDDHQKQALVNEIMKYVEKQADMEQFSLQLQHTVPPRLLQVVHLLNDPVFRLVIVISLLILSGSVIWINIKSSIWLPALGTTAIAAGVVLLGASPVLSKIMDSLGSRYHLLSKMAVQFTQQIRSHFTIAGVTVVITGGLMILVYLGVRYFLMQPQGAENTDL